MRGKAGTAVGVLLCVAVLGGCGGRQEHSPVAEQQQVRGTMARFVQASAQGDYASLCTRLLSGELVAKIRSVGVPCELAVRTGLDSVDNPRLKIGSVFVRGDRASVMVRSWADGQQPSTDVVQLVRERGAWRVASLAGGG
jgi:hypothetical protein